MQHVELTRSISEWLTRIGIADPDARADLAVDLADVLHAAEVARGELQEMLRLPMQGSQDAETGLRQAASIEVQLFTELKDHLVALEARWPLVLKALDRKVTSGRGKP